MREVQNSEKIDIFHSFDNVVKNSNYLGNVTRYFFLKTGITRNYYY